MCTYPFTYLCGYFFKKGHPGLSFVFFKQTIQFLQQINVKKCPSSIWCWDSTRWPSEHESPPITTRPGFLPNVAMILIRESIILSNHYCKSTQLFNQVCLNYICSLRQEFVWENNENNRMQQYLVTRYHSNGRNNISKGGRATTTTTERKVRQSWKQPTTSLCS